VVFPHASETLTHGAHVSNVGLNIPEYCVTGLYTIFEKYRTGLEQFMPLHSGCHM